MQVAELNQLTDALRILFVEMVQATWSLDFNWKLKFSFREPVSEQVVIPDNTKSSVIANISVSSGEHSVVISAASLFPEFFNRLVIEIRIRQYSIRTEQAYAGWVARFLMYHKFTSDVVIQVN